MELVIDFFFSLLSQIWECITSYWLLSFSFLILVISFIVSLVVGTEGNN